MTDFWDATEIPYSDSWDDDMYDSLMRYVYEIDETTYNTKAGLPKTDAEIIKYVEDSTVDNINLAEDTASMLQETGTQVIDWENRENWRARIAPEVVYALMAIAVGPVARDVFINWDLEGIDGYFAAVDDLKDIDVYSFYETALEAEEYANAAYNHGTCGGWRGPISIIKITNFRNAYYKSGISPEYSIVKTI